MKKLFYSLILCGLALVSTQLQAANDGVISADEPVGSFADLSKAILGSNTELDIKTDYKFNSATEHLC